VVVAATARMTPGTTALRVVLFGLVAVVAVEGGLRALRRGGHTALPIYASLAPPALVTDADVVGLFGVTPYRVVLDARGLRVPSAPRGTVLLGDSIAFGLGVEGEESLAARCTGNGHPMLGAAGPAFSTLDALARGEAFGGAATDFVVVLNPTDDDAPPLAETAALAGAWLVRRDAPGALRAVLASWAGDTQLVHDLLHVGVALSPTPPVRRGFDGVGSALAAFVAAHPRTTVVWAMPAPGHPASAAAAADLATVRAHVPVAALRLADAWLADGVHWTPAGTEAVAAQLCPATPR